MEGRRLVNSTPFFLAFFLPSFPPSYRRLSVDNEGSRRGSWSEHSYSCSSLCWGTQPSPCRGSMLCHELSSSRSIWIDRWLPDHTKSRTLYDLCLTAQPYVDIPNQKGKIPTCIVLSGVDQIDHKHSVPIFRPIRTEGKTSVIPRFVIRWVTDQRNIIRTTMFLGGGYIIHINKDSD